MASEADRIPPAEDTEVVDLADQPTQSDEEWPVSDLYLVEPAEDYPPPDSPADEPEPVRSAAETGVLRADAPPATPASPRTRRRFPPDMGPGLLLAIGGAVAAIILVALLLGLRQDNPATARTSTTPATTSEQTPTTPKLASSHIALRDLKGMRVAEARSLLEKQGLRVQVSRLQSDRPGGEVLTQRPPAGTTVAKGDTVTLLVSSEARSQPTSSVRVPGVIGLLASEAAREIRGAGLRPRIRHVTSSQAAGTVVEQAPAENETVSRDSEVRLDVAQAAREPVRVDVPDVVGSSAAAARRELRSAGFTVSVVMVDSQEPVGTVISQSPRAGADLSRGSEVTLRVSSGPATVGVPDVTSLDESAATAQLEGAGFQVRVTDESTTDPAQDGLVVRQSPQGGSTAEEGALVTITVARLG